MTSPYPESGKGDYSPPSVDELRRDVDALEARISEGERKIADALTIEIGTVEEYEAHYRRVLTEASDAGRRIAALAVEGGA